MKPILAYRRSGCEELRRGRDEAVFPEVLSKVMALAWFFSPCFPLETNKAQEVLLSAANQDFKQGLPPIVERTLRPLALGCCRPSTALTLPGMPALCQERVDIVTLELYGYRETG